MENIITSETAPHNGATVDAQLSDAIVPEWANDFEAYVLDMHDSSRAGNDIAQVLGRNLRGKVVNFARDLGIVKSFQHQRTYNQLCYQLDVADVEKEAEATAKQLAFTICQLAAGQLNEQDAAKAQSVLNALALHLISDNHFVTQWSIRPAYWFYRGVESRRPNRRFLSAKFNLFLIHAKREAKWKETGLEPDTIFDWLEQATSKAFGKGKTK